MGFEHDQNGKNQTNAPSPAAQADDAAASRKRKGGKLWTVVFVVALIVLIGSLAALGAIWFSYFQGQQKYDELENYAQVQPADDPATLSVDWEKLKSLNAETVAWLYMPNTAINYPVVKGQDNDYYLTHDFDGDQGWLANYGAIFMDYRNNPDWSDNAYFIYGHHMNDGSMFADLAGMADQARFDECRTVYVLSPTGNFKLRTFALVHCPSTETIVQTSFGSREEMAQYVQDKVDRSVVRVADAPPSDAIRKVFAFATCDNVSDGRYVLFAYVEATTADGLVGVVGAMEEEGETGFVNELRTE